MGKERARIELKQELDLVLPDGSTVRVKPGPYGKGVSLIPLSDSAGSSSEGRGRKPRAGTVRLRKRLARDVQKDQLRNAADYVKWMMKQDSDVTLATARQIVYRERRVAMEGGLAQA